MPSNEFVIYAYYEHWPAFQNRLTWKVCAISQQAFSAFHAIDAHWFDCPRTPVAEVMMLPCHSDPNFESQLPIRSRQGRSRGHPHTRFTAHRLRHQVKLSPLNSYLSGLQLVVECSRSALSSDNLPKYDKKMKSLKVVKSLNYFWPKPYTKLSINSFVKEN